MNLWAWAYLAVWAMLMWWFLERSQQRSPLYGTDVTGDAAMVEDAREIARMRLRLERRRLEEELE